MNNFLKKNRHKLRRWWNSFRLPAVLTFDFYWEIVAWPFKTVFTAWQQARVRNLLLGLPALLAVAGLVWFSASSRLQASAISSSYWVKAGAAMSAKDYASAQILLNRILEENSGHREDALHALAILFEDVGQTDRAAALFRLLAPEGKQGYSNAHRRLAILTSSKINSQSSPNDLKAFAWHLQAAHDDTSAEMAVAWGRYCLATRDIDGARKFFRLAVEQHPELLTTLGQIEAATGNTDAAVSNYEKASEYLSVHLRSNPADYMKRIDYAQVMMRLGKFDIAKIILEEGLRSNPDQETTWNWLLASLYVNFHDIMSAEGRPISELLNQIDKALVLDPNHGAALTRLMAYATAKVEGNVELRTILSRVIAEGEQPALAHLAMGNLCWMEDKNEQAMFHFEQAMEIRSDVPVMLNNLAWLISHDEKKPDLDRSLAMINAALEKQPDNASFLDTRGNIFVMRKEWRSALTDLEKALKDVKDKKAVHKNLALIYEQLELPEIADQHRRLGVEIVDQPK